jgi:hypothetical protein
MPSVTFDDEGNVRGDEEMIILLFTLSILDENNELEMEGIPLCG